jgi:indolepyruvate ferredoxin oxidoreductase, beta subunit
VPYLAADGAVLANSQPVVNISEYPPLEEVLAAVRRYPRHVLVDADQLAKEAGSVRASNMVMLGLVSPVLDLPEECLQETIRQAFARKGEAIVATNLTAFAAGRAAGLQVGRR